MIDGHHEAQTLREQDTIAIHIQRIKEAARHCHALIYEQVAEELGRQLGSIGFPLVD